MKASNGQTVKVHYTGKLTDNTVFDSSINREPLEFTLGQGMMIQGFEQAVLGMQVGESKTTSILANEAYGQIEPDRIFQVPKNEFPGDMNLQIGLQIYIEYSDGYSMPASVTAIQDDAVTLDTNHPLAGKDLIFDIQLVEILPEDNAEKPLLFD